MGFFYPQCIFITYRKSNTDIVLLQPSIINDNIQARSLWAGLFGSVIHFLRRSEEGSGGKEQEKQKKGRRFRKRKTKSGTEEAGNRHLWDNGGYSWDIFLSIPPVFHIPPTLFSGYHVSCAYQCFITVTSEQWTPTPTLHSLNDRWGWEWLLRRSEKQ